MASWPTLSSEIFSPLFHLNTLPTSPEDLALNIVEAPADLVLITTAQLNLIKKERKMTNTVKMIGLMTWRKSYSSLQEVSTFFKKLETTWTSIVQPSSARLTSMASAISPFQSWLTGYKKRSVSPSTQRRDLWYRAVTVADPLMRSLHQSSWTKSRPFLL